MLIKWGLIVIIVIMGISCTVFQFENKNIKGIILSIISTIALSIISSFIYDYIKSSLPTPPISATTDDIDVDNETKDSDSIENNKNSEFSKNGTVPTTQKVTTPTNHMEDITGKSSISDSIIEEGQKNSYKFTSKVGGTYRFDTNLSAGGEAIVRISGENSKSLKYDIDGLTIDLEEGKTYILSIEYRNSPCDYSISIGVPIAVTDITESTSISGSITYQDQKNKYRYTAPTNGTYRFDTNLSAGGEVIVRISGENGKSLNYNINGLTIDLEAGKTYILSTEYRNGSCDYTINIGMPIAVTNITESTSISGSITYQGQKDKYRYTAPTSGTYCFDTNLSAGGEVIVRISGENGKSLNYGTNNLTTNLEEGKTYILSIEYRNEPCVYELFIEVS